MKKQYLLSITGKRPDGKSITFSAGFYCDTPNKNIRLYYDGSDAGYRYEYLGNASRHLEDTARGWAEYGVSVTRKYGTKEEMPLSGSNAPYYKYSKLWKTFVPAVMA